MIKPGDTGNVSPGFILALYCYTPSAALHFSNGKQMLEDAWRHKRGEDIDVVDIGPDTPIAD